MTKTFDVVLSADEAAFVLARGDSVAQDRGTAAIATSGNGDMITANGLVDGAGMAGILIGAAAATPIADPSQTDLSANFTFASGSAAITVGKSGTVSGATGILLQVPQDDRDPTNDGSGTVTASLVNKGDIEGTSGFALIAADHSQFTSIDNRSGGRIGGIEGDVRSLTNEGVIDGGKLEALLLADLDTVTNKGTITGSGAVATIVSDAVQLSNSGTVSATGSGDAVLGGRLDITNAAGGMISAKGGIAIEAGAMAHSVGVLTLVNSGEIVGNVIGADTTVFGGGDTVDQSGGGTIKGDVLLGDGDDRFVATVNSKGHLVTGVSGTLDGGSGYNTLAIAAAKNATFSLPALPTDFEALEIDPAKGAVLTVTGKHLAPVMAGGTGTLVLDGTYSGAMTALTLAAPDVGALTIENDGHLTDTAGDNYTSGTAIILVNNLEGQYVGGLGAFINKGVISSTLGGISIAAAGSSNFTFNNSGTITTSYGTAAGMDLAGSKKDSFTNTGTIHSGQDTALSITGSPLSGIDPTSAVLTNKGEISGGSSGARLEDVDLVNMKTISASNGDGVVFASGDQMHSLNNSGSIIGSANGLSIYDGSRIENSGTITGGTNGLYLQGGNITIDNAKHGTINGGIVSSGDQVSGTVTNEGHINGGLYLYSIVFDAAAPGFSIANTGTITGDVTLSNQNDSFDSSSGSMKGLIYGAGGDDVIHGGKQGIAIDGGDGNDTLDGGVGNDTITGGEGQDFMAGGDGHNDFRFTDSSQFSGSTWSTADRIEDFKTGDEIDLRGLFANSMPNTLSFIGTSHFDGGAEELRYAFVGSNTAITGDFDGDKHADFTIMLKGHVTLTAADFLLH